MIDPEKGFIVTSNNKIGPHFNVSNTSCNILSDISDTIPYNTRAYRIQHLIEN